MKANLLKVLSVLLIAGTFVACTSNNNTSTPAGEGSTTQTSQNGGGTEETSKAEESLIKSLTAVNDNAEMKLGESKTATTFYKLEGFKALNAKNKKVTAVAADPTIISVNSSSTSFTAVGVGSTTITVTSNIDTTKSCTFTITVTDVYFDRTYSMVDSSWDMSKEMPDAGAEVTVTTNNADGLYFKGSDALRWYAETTIKINSINDGENYPKFGLVASTTTHTEIANNKVYFFLDAFNYPTNTSWTNFGVCEVSGGTNWAWNPGVTNGTARHQDNVHSVTTPVTLGTEFSMGMLRDGHDLHLYVGGNYVKSVTALGELLGNWNAETQSFDAVNCMAGLFSFNSNVTFSKYAFTADETEVSAKLAAIETKDYLTEWAAD